MAYEFYVTIEGTKQGALKGESIREAHKDKIAGLAFYYELQSPRDAATGLASGKRQHRPITFTKEWGAASPQIFQALATNEVLKSVLFEFIRTTPEGVEEIHYTIKLTDATVSNLKQYVSMTHHAEATDIHELEDVSLTFKKIELDNKLASTAASDDWTQ